MQREQGNAVNKKVNVFRAHPCSPGLSPGGRAHSSEISLSSLGAADAIAILPELLQN